MPDTITTLVYLVAAVCFIIGLKRLGKADTAKSGNRISAVGMLLAIVVSLFGDAIISLQVISEGMIAGGMVGLWMACTVKMTAISQMVAVLNGVGGGESFLMRSAEFLQAD